MVWRRRRVSRMDRRLVAVNAALLGVLVWVTLVAAQPGVPAGRGRGEYTMVSGRIQGATTSGIYIVDAANQEVVAMSWDRSLNRLEPIGHRSLVDDGKFLAKPR